MNAPLGLVCLLFAGLLAVPAPAQDTLPSAEKKAVAETVATNGAPAIKPDASAAASTSSVAAESPLLPALEKGAAGTNVDSQSKTNKAAGPDEIQVSFQGANIDMIVQWLAQTTGKSVVKHPQVQCQLTITSSKKVSTREAITLVYRALALEGFTAIESSNSILIVPEGKEPKMSPELLDASRKDIPEGRQRLVKIFSLSHIQAAELREKVRGDRNPFFETRGCRRTGEYAWPHTERASRRRSDAVETLAFVRRWPIVSAGDEFHARQLLTSGRRFFRWRQQFSV